MHIKLVRDGSAAGYLYPKVILISRLSETEMHNEEFIVQLVDALGINRPIVMFLFITNLVGILLYSSLPGFLKYRHILEWLTIF